MLSNQRGCVRWRLVVFLAYSFVAVWSELKSAGKRGPMMRGRAPFQARKRQKVGIPYTLTQRRLVSFFRSERERYTDKEGPRSVGPGFSGLRGFFYHKKRLCEGFQTNGLPVKRYSYGKFQMLAVFAYFMILQG